MDTVVALEDVRKTFAATRALDGVTFDIRAGEVHALVGENGAGKSTLMNILSGVYPPDDGTILIAGTPRTLRSTHDAGNAGIATVFQELSLVDGLSVEENICAGAAPTRYGLIDRAAMRRRAAAALSRLGATLPPGSEVGRLLASQRQTVEISKALDQLEHAKAAAGPDGVDVRVLILDEPTSALNAEEKRALFVTVRALRAEGVAIVYISHHLDEVLRIADRITVLRDGATVWTRENKGLDADTLVGAMVGRVVERADRARHTGADVVASFKSVSRTNRLEQVSFDLRRGEILAVAGLEGSGRETVARVLAGVEPAETGTATLLGRPHPGSLRAAMALGLAYVPDDRKRLGLFLDLPIMANALSADLAAVARFGFISTRAMKAGGAALLRAQKVKAEGPSQPVGSLSGGNQQKVLFGKWLRRNPQILVVEEPTKGVDIRAKQDIHDEIAARALAGAAVLLVSSDLPEMLALADRILVLHQGRVVGELDGQSATEEEVMSLASGTVGTQVAQKEGAPS